MSYAARALALAGPPLLRRCVGAWSVRRYAGAGQLLDLTGRGHHFTLNGSPALTPGAHPFLTLAAASTQSLETPDHDDFDFGPGQDFTIVLVGRIPDMTITATHTYVAKRVGLALANTGWSLIHGGGANQVAGGATDGAAGVNATATLAGQSGAIVTLAYRRVGTEVASFINTTRGVNTDTSTGTLANSEVVRVGRLSGAGTNYANLDVFGLGIARVGLTEPQVACLARDLRYA